MIEYKSSIASIEVVMDKALFCSGCMLEEFKFFTVDEKNEPTKNGKGLLIAETKKGVMIYNITSFSVIGN